MTELKKIQYGLAREGRNAYHRAKSKNNAYVLNGNSIYRVSADGSREVVESLPKTRVLVRRKEYSFND